MSGFASNFTAKNIKTVLENTAKHNFVVVFVLEGAAVSKTSKMSSSVKAGNQETLSLTTSVEFHWS